MKNKMTTLVGICAEKNEPAVVLASDISATFEDWEQRGDIARRVMQKGDTEKIYVDQGRELAVGMSGIVDKNFYNFLSALLRGQVNFRSRLERMHFEELFILNYGRMDGELWSKPDNALLV